MKMKMIHVCIEIIWHSRNESTFDLFRHTTCKWINKRNSSREENRENMKIVKNIRTKDYIRHDFSRSLFHSHLSPRISFYRENKKGTKRA